jgi:hypothetical protein
VHEAYAVRIALAFVSLFSTASPNRGVLPDVNTMAGLLTQF